MSVQVGKEYESPSFKEFWDLYDKKIDRKRCEKLWNKFCPECRYEILQHVFLYVKSTPNKQYRKNPYTYLFNECYHDEIIETNTRHNEAFEHIINHYSQ